MKIEDQYALLRLTIALIVLIMMIIVVGVVFVEYGTGGYPRGLRCSTIAATRCDVDPSTPHQSFSS